MNYTSAQAFLAKGKNKDRRPLPGRSSSMIRRSDDIAVRYHNTDVVTFHPNDRITLNSDGYRTMTTKDRINEYSPVNVYQRGGLWYMPDGSLFYDGIVIDAEGKVLKPRKPEATEGKKAKLDKLVYRYVRAFQDQIKRDHKLPEPSAGDCWLCGLVATDGTTMGGNNVDHILSHLKERYIFGSILWQAVQRRGNPAFCWQYGQSYAERGDGSFLMDDLRYYLRTRKAAMLELM